MNFVTERVCFKFILLKEIFILDNAAVHYSAAAKKLEDFLGNVKIDT